MVKNLPLYLPPRTRRGQGRAPTVLLAPSLSGGNEVIKSRKKNGGLLLRTKKEAKKRKGKKSGVKKKFDSPTLNQETLVICDIGQVAYRGPWTKTILPKTTLLTQTSTEVHWIFGWPDPRSDTHTYAYAILIRSVYIYLDRFYTTHTDAYAIPIRMHTERASRHAHTAALPRLCTGPPPVFFCLSGESI